MPVFARSGCPSLPTAAAAAGSGVDTRIVQMNGTTALINVGASAGVKVGDKFTIVRLGPELVDPITGAKLGAPEEQVGTAVVTAVQPAFATVTITGKALAKDALRKQ